MFDNQNRENWMTAPPARLVRAERCWTIRFEFQGHLRILSTQTSLRPDKPGGGVPGSRIAAYLNHAYNYPELCDSLSGRRSPSLSARSWRPLFNRRRTVTDETPSTWAAST